MAGKAVNSRQLKSISRISVTHQVFEQLKAQLIDGTWQPGAKIPSENELCRSLGVSRIPVREALQRLSTLGILETRHGEGTFVRRASTDSYIQAIVPGLILDKPELMELLEYRRIVEPNTAAVAARKATADDIAELERCYAAMQAHADDREQFALGDVEFHLAIARATKNRILVQINNVILDILGGFMKTIVDTLGVADGLRYHSQLLEAIRRGDPDLAHNIMDEHVLRTIERIENLPAFSDAEAPV